jgi:hypothetical protein
MMMCQRAQQRSAAAPQLLLVCVRLCIAGRFIVRSARKL